METDETDISAEQNQTGKNPWVFKTDVNQAGPAGPQQAAGQRTKKVGGVSVAAIIVRCKRVLD